MKKCFYRFLLFVLAFVLALPTMPQTIYAGNDISLEIVAEDWGKSESAFTIQCNGIEDVSQITIWTAVYRGPMFYGFAIVESVKNNDGMFHVTVKHLPYSTHDNASVKVFLLDARSFAPQSQAAEETHVFSASDIPDTPDTPVKQEGNVFKTYLTSEVASLNFLDNVDGNASTPSAYAMSQLWRMYPNEDGTNYIWIDDLAVGDPIKVDAYNWQIKLREGATWQNGDPINADTWIYTFRQQLDPKLQMRMATFLYDNSVTIVNGENYMMQGTDGYPSFVAWEDVGLKKVDEYTIQITTEDRITDPVTIKKHFDNRNNVPVHQGMWQACLSADGKTTSYGSDLEHFIGCGPYVFAQWDMDEQQIYVKNEDHWLAEYFNFDQIQVRIVPWMNQRIQLFEQGEIHMLSPDSNTIEQYLDDPRMVTYGSTSVTHIDINCKNPDNPISGSVNYRKAIYHAINREYAAENFFGHMQPAGTYVNSQAGMLSESALTYRDSEYGNAVEALVESWGPYGYNPKMALDYLNKAIAECGVAADQLPIKVKYCIDAGDREWLALAEYLQEQWHVIFEGKMELEIVTYAGMSATDFKRTGDDKWDLSPNDWARSMSRTYPHTCFYYYLNSYSGRPNNYVVPEFDIQFQVCENVKLGDYENLLKETQKLEELYLEYVIHVPMCQSVNYELVAECLELPVKTYIPGFGWGAVFGSGGDDLEEDDYVPIPTPPDTPDIPIEPDTPDTPVAGYDPLSGIAYAEDTTFDYLYSSEITSMNYLATSLSQNQKSLANFVDTLIEFDSYGNIVPCLAESWSVSDDGLTWTFNIREGVKWYTCEGKEYAELTAHDFVAAARLVADPKFDSDMPDMLISYIVNGMELYNWFDESTEPDFTTLGVEASDDYTLVYHLRQPCPHFLTMLGYSCYMPVNADFYESLEIEDPEPVINDDGTEGDPITNEFGTDRDKILYCGGYICSSWQPQEEYVWVKNENYWDAENIHIEKVSGKYNAQADAIAPEMYLRGEIDECSVPAYILGDWMYDDNADFVHTTMPTGFVQYMLLNFNQKHEDSVSGGYYDMAVNNKNFRKAIYHGIDYLYCLSAYDPFTPETIAHSRMVPNDFCVIDGKDYNAFGKSVQDFNEIPFDEALAIDYANKAKAELEAAGCVFPIQMPLYYNPRTPNMDQCCQLLEAQLEATLGNDFIEITVFSGPATNYIAEVRRAGIWGLFEGGWGPDYQDPATFFEPFSFGWTYGSQEKIKGDQYKTGYIYTQEDYDKPGVKTAV